MGLALAVNHPFHHFAKYFIDFKLAHTFLIKEEKNNQEGSLCSDLLEANMIVRANTFCKNPCPKAKCQMLTKCSEPLKEVLKKHTVSS